MINVHLCAPCNLSNPILAEYNPLQTLAIHFLVMKASLEGLNIIVVEIVTQNWLKAIGQIRI